MALVDELKIHIKAGDGGDGVVRWRHEKSKEFAGASGGNGGKGGDVYIRAVSDIGLLASYRHNKIFKAENGQSGMKESRHGKDGDDFVLDLPVGSVVENLSTGEIFRLDTGSQKMLILKGGRGGVGNEFFKSSVNTSPEEATQGVGGEEADFLIELEMFADVGFIGFPGAGKSSLLNALTSAKAKTGSYAFTTLDPNLGAFFEFVLADIPGLIEGASEGKGLGYKFLKHIKRTRLLCHLISVENDDLLEAYRVVRKELEKFDKTLLAKKEVVVLTKIDESDAKKTASMLKSLGKLGVEVFAVSVIDDAGLKNFKDSLVKILRGEK